MAFNFLGTEASTSLYKKGNAGFAKKVPWRVQQSRLKYRYTFKLLSELLRNNYTSSFPLLGKHLYGLVHAASGYKRVLKENCKLYNQVQDLKGKIMKKFIST